MNGLIVNFIVLVVSIFIGMSIRNQLNEGKNPLVSFVTLLKDIGEFFKKQYIYCMTKIPNKKAK